MEKDRGRFVEAMSQGFSDDRTMVYYGVSCEEGVRDWLRCVKI